MQLKKKILIILLLVNIFVIQLNSTQGFLSNTNKTFSTDIEVILKIDYSMNLTSASSKEILLDLWLASLQDQSIDENSNNQSLMYQNIHLLDEIYPDNYNYFNSSYDSYENLYYSFQSVISPNNPEFYYRASQNVTLKGFEWNIPADLTIDDYDLESELYLNYTANQPFTEVNDTDIQEMAALIQSQSTESLKDLLENTYLQVVDVLDYEVIDGDAKGAEQALEDGIGDCSEYSSLLVTLLRANGIPARKVLGFVLIEGDLTSAQPQYNLKEGDVYSYSIKEGNIPAHAWVQVYVPDFGWMSVDPTWGDPLGASDDSNLTYLYNRDYIRIITTIGDYYPKDDFVPPLEFQDESKAGLAEFPYIYFIMKSSSFINANLIDYDYIINVEVLEVINPFNPGFTLDWATIFIGISSSFLLIFIMIVYNAKKSKNKQRRRKGY